MPHRHRADPDDPTDPAERWRRGLIGPTDGPVDREAQVESAPVAREAVAGSAPSAPPPRAVPSVHPADASPADAGPVDGDPADASPVDGTSSGRRWSSRVLHRLNEATAHSTTGLVAAATILAWVLYGALARFPSWWDTVLYVVSSTITLLMVFAIQHTQARQQSAMQRKLDELLHALPRADGRLIAVEEAPDGELEALANQDIAERDQAVDSLGAIRPTRPAEGDPDATA